MIIKQRLVLRGWFSILFFAPRLRVRLLLHYTHSTYIIDKWPLSQSIYGSIYYMLYAIGYTIDDILTSRLYFFFVFEKKSSVSGVNKLYTKKEKSDLDIF